MRKGLEIVGQARNDIANKQRIVSISLFKKLLHLYLFCDKMSNIALLCLYGGVYPCSRVREPYVHKEVSKMNKYEMTVIVRSDLEEELFKAEMEKIQSLITRFGGTIEKIDEWGKRKLAYEINKMSEGVYTFIHFVSDSSAPAEIEKRVRIMENVIRYLIIRKED